MFVGFRVHRFASTQHRLELVLLANVCRGLNRIVGSHSGRYIPLLRCTVVIVILYG